MEDMMWMVLLLGLGHYEGGGRVGPGGIKMMGGVEKPI